MPWLRLDDGFAENHKIIDLKLPAKWLHVSALCYCARNLTDGNISRKQLQVICAIADVPKPQIHVRALVDAGLWLEDESEDGCYVVNDFLKYNPSREQVAKDRDAARERQSRSRSQRSHAVTDGVTDGVSHTTPTHPNPSKEQSRAVTALSGEQPSDFKIPNLREVS